MTLSRALHGARTISIALCVSLPLFGVVLRGQDGPAVSVAAAFRDVDGDLIPDRLGETVSLTGVVTSEPRMIDVRTASRTHIQDDTGGVRLTAPGNLIVAAGLDRNDAIRVRGTIQQFDGREEFVVAALERLGRREAPRPHEVTVAELQSEEYSGQLVRVAGRLTVPLSILESSRDVIIRDATGEIRVFLQRALFRDFDFINRLRRGGRAELVAIAEQFDERAPFDSGYRIVPRDVGDFHFAPGPPYGAIGITSSVFVLLGLAVGFWSFRRASERQTVAVATREQFATMFLWLFTNSPLAMLIHDAKSLRLLDVNEAAITQYGYSRVEFLHMRLPDMDARQGPRSMSRPQVLEFRHQTRAGALMDVDLVAHPLEFRGRQAVLVTVTKFTPSGVSKA